MYLFNFLPATYENSIHSNSIVSLLNVNLSSVYVAYLLTVVWICIYLTINDIEHLFMSLLAIYIYLLWWMCLLKPFTCLKKCGYSIILLLSSVYCKYSLPVLWLIFHFLNNIFPRIKVQELMKSIFLFSFSFIVHAFDILRNLCLFKVAKTF